MKITKCVLRSLKEFLSRYADDRGLTFEFVHITDRFRDRDFLLPELQLPVPSVLNSTSMTTTAITNPPSNRPSTASGNAPTPHLLHPVGTPASSLNPLTPASVGPSSQSQQQANSPSQPMISPSPGFMSMGSPMMANTVGSPMTNTPAPAQLPVASPMTVPTASPGNLYGKILDFLSKFSLKRNSVLKKCRISVPELVNLVRHFPDHFSDHLLAHQLI